MRRKSFQKDVDTAEKKKLHRLITDHPQRVSNFKQLAGLMREDKQYASAVAVLTKALDLHPGDTALQSHLAKTHHESGDIEKAIELYQEVIAANPDDPVPYEKIEKICKERGMYERAVRLYRRMPNNSALKELSHQRIHFLLVEKIRDVKRGIANLVKAIDDFGPSYHRCKDLGRLYTKMGKWREAAQLYEQALQFKKDDYLIGMLGWALVDSGELKRAEECFKQIDGTFHGAVSLAELFLRLGRADEAEIKLDSLAHRYPGNTRIAIGYAELALTRGDARTALTLCEETLPRVPAYFSFEQAHAHEVTAAVFRALGKTEAARRHNEMAKTLKKGPDTYTALITLAERKIAARNLPGAEAVLDRILELYPNNTRALINRGEIALLKDEPRIAAEVGEKALERSRTRYVEEQMRGHLMLSKAYSLLGDRNNSRMHKERAKALRSDTTQEPAGRNAKRKRR
jgi:tetratricopeptide (TPR) repeat protein